MEFQRWSIALGLLILMGGGSVPSFAEKRFSLRLIGDINISTNTYIKNTVLGGLSGVTYNPNSQELIMVSDDRGNVNPPRIYRFFAKVTMNQFLIQAYDVHFLRNAQGLLIAPGQFDGEGIGWVEGTGSYLISSEGNLGANPPISPGMYRFDTFGNYLGEVGLPEEYLPQYSSSGEQVSGTANNRGPECLTMSGSERFWTANESTLIQDMEFAPFTSRVVEYVRNDGQYVENQLFFYPYGPSNIDEIDTTHLDLGITEFAAFDENHLFVLERNFNNETYENLPAIYSVKMEGNVLKKHRVLDLQKIIPQLSPGFRSLDNLEGMTFGPHLPNGNRTLILVSDNNFNSNQRTQLLAFEVYESIVD